jgi:hypothetical protein
MLHVIRAFSVSVAILLAAGFSGQAMAEPVYTTIDIDGYVDWQITNAPGTMPIGVSTGNQATNIPFDVSASPNNPNWSGIWLADGVGDTLSIDLGDYNLTGQTTVYALLNNFYGTPNANEYNVTISTATQSIAFTSIGSVDTRDYNAAWYTNSLLAATTTPWFDNGQGQRYDVRTFALPASFADEQITSFSITQVRNGDVAVFAGLTFYGTPPVPEPETYALWLAALGLMGAVIRRRKTA